MASRKKTTSSGPALNMVRDAKTRAEFRKAVAAGLKEKMTPEQQFAFDRAVAVKDWILEDMERRRGR